MEKEEKEVNEHRENDDTKTTYGLKKDESLLSVKFAPPENPDLRE
ncbi:hypothetical protein V1499_12495 [Neobacillus sp. SCS-31]